MVGPYRFGEGKVKALGEGFELVGEVTPFAHLRVGEVVGRGELARLGLGEFARLVFPPVPEFPHAKEVGAGHAELRVLLVGLLFRVDGTPARVVACERRHDGDCGGEDSVFGRGEEHAREAGFHGNLCEFASGVREGGSAFGGVSDGAELEQFAETFADHRGLGRVEEGELLDVA